MPEDIGVNTFIKREREGVMQINKSIFYKAIQMA